MRAATAVQAKRLEQLMPGRVNFDRRERSMYSHDVGALPGLIKPFLGNTLPAGVVQPVSEGEIARLQQIRQGSFPTGDGAGSVAAAGSPPC